MKFDVDKVFCISLKNRTDRQEISKINLNVLSNETERWLVKKDDENPERGCYRSHMEIAKYGLDHGLERIMVFEDDVIFHRVASSREMKRFNNFIKSDIGDLVYLGGLLGEMYLTRKVGIVQCKLFCTQSYVINRSGMRKLASKSYTGIPIDVHFMLNFNTFSVFPMLTSQISAESCESDIAANSARAEILTNNSWLKNRRSQYLSILRNICRSAPV